MTSWVVALLATGMPASFAAPKDGRGGGKGRHGGGGGAGPWTVSSAPVDYIAQKGSLSQPEYPETVTEEVRLAAFDGADLYLRREHRSRGRGLPQR
ncbi:MAG: hypothetical protein GEU74_13030 [Nitriliruptorales bacterium]|nr:hypothetical protein [Nitriliruptorales bacterium]